MLDISVQAVVMPQDTTKKIFVLLRWIKQNILRDELELSEPYFVLKNKKGDCQGFSNLFMVLCNGIDIDCRTVVGIIVLKQKNENYKYFFHQWVEYLDGVNWIPCDPTFGFETIGNNYIKLKNLNKRIDLIAIYSEINSLKLDIIK